MQLVEHLETRLQFNEAGKADGAIGSFEGPAFIVEGASGNGRWYSRKLWQIQLEKLQGRIKNRQLLGALGHGTSLADEDLANASHVVTSMSMSEASTQGRASYDILDTAPGRALKALMKAGVVLSVSTRAQGEFLPQKRPDGTSEINPETFACSGIDIVMNPGVAFAQPKLAESLCESLDEKARVELQVFLESGSPEKAPSTPVLDITKGNPPHAQGETSMSVALEKYEAVLEAKSQAEGKVATMLESSRTVSDEKAAAVAEAAELKTQVETLTAEVAELKEAAEGHTKDAEALKAFEAISTVDELKDLCKLVEQYQALGTVAEIEDTFAKAEAQLEAISKQAYADKVESLAKKYGVEKDLVEKVMVPELSDKTIESILESMKPSEASNRYGTFPVQDDAPTADQTPIRGLTERLWA